MWRILSVMLIDGYQILPMPRKLDRNIYKHTKMLIHYGVTQIETLMDMYFFSENDISHR